MNNVKIGDVVYHISTFLNDDGFWEFIYKKIKVINITTINLISYEKQCVEYIKDDVKQVATFDNIKLSEDSAKNYCNMYNNIWRQYLPNRG